MTFDTTVFLEATQENRPVVIFTENGTIFDVYIPEGEISFEYLHVDVGDDEDGCESDDRDTMIEILEGIGYISAAPCTYTEYIRAEDDGENECGCDD